MHVIIQCHEIEVVQLAFINMEVESRKPAFGIEQVYLIERSSGIDR